MVRVVVASKNKKKLIEVRDIWGKDFEVVGLEEVGVDVGDIAEDTDTFIGNAVKKSVWTARKVGCLCVADDSGLEVEALGGRPGVYSARFSGEDKNDLKNNEKVLSLMRGKDNRRARFVCYMALADERGLVGVCCGYVYGRISFEMAGDTGFGYDPIFIPDGYDKTFAQLGYEVKNKVSHRKKALEELLDILRIYLEVNLPL